jgi:hypothetical protein
MVPARALAWFVVVTLSAKELEAMPRTVRSEDRETKLFMGQNLQE